MAALTCNLVASFSANNKITAEAMPDFIIKIYQVVRGICQDGEVDLADNGTLIKRPTPSEVRRSITEEALISFIDGKPYRSLKPHLSKNGMTFPQYCQRYGLPVDYPAVAPGYSAYRSRIAKNSGLGRGAARRLADDRREVSDAGRRSLEGTRAK